MMNGDRHFSLNFRLYWTPIRGLWFHPILPKTFCIASRFLKQNIMLMALLNARNHIWWQRAFINKLAWITLKFLVLLLSIRQCVLSFLLLLNMAGLFINWMCKMPFFIVTSLKMCSCNNQLVFRILTSLIMSANSRKSSMASSKLLELGFQSFVRNCLSWVSLFHCQILPCLLIFGLS